MFFLNPQQLIHVRYLASCIIYCLLVNPLILMDFLMCVERISIELPILYVKRSQVEISKS